MDQETKKEFKNLTKIIQQGFGDVEKRFQCVDKRFEGIDKRFEKIEKTMATKDDLKAMATKKDLGKLNIELRDFIDNKLVDLKGDLIVLMRKEDSKLTDLIKILKQKSILTDKEADGILSSEPFAQLLHSKRA